MTIVQPIQIQRADSIFEEWNSLGVSGRAELLTRTLILFPEIQRKMAIWQIDNAQHKIAETLIMPGPTGERNELSTQGRGTFLCMTNEDSETAIVGLVGQVFAALIAGNPVITVGLKGQEIVDQIATVLTEGVVQNITESALDSIIEANSLAGVTIICDDTEAQTLSQRLAAKSGLICQLVTETDSQTLAAITSPNYILRFVTERTVSVNTTAIGGNATLLELGA